MLLRFLPRSLFARFAVTPRELWVLETLAAGSAPVASLDAAVVDGFVSRGWAAVADGAASLTPEGTRIHETIQRNVRTLGFRRDRMPHPRRPGV